MEKSWKFQGGGGSNTKPSGTENPVGWGSNWKKPSVGGGGGGMDIFWNHTMKIAWNLGRGLWPKHSLYSCYAMLHALRFHMSLGFSVFSAFFFINVLLLKALTFSFLPIPFC